MTRQNNIDEPRQAAQAALDDFKAAETERLQESKARKAGKEKKKKLWVAGQWLFLVICAGTIVFQLPQVMAALNQVEKPLRHGTFQTDALTDDCIRQLWRVSKLLQEGKLPPAELLCPASKKAFIVQKTSRDIIVRSPSPEIYGFKDLVVSRRKPVPKIIK